MGELDKPAILPIDRPQAPSGSDLPAVEPVAAIDAPVPPKPPGPSDERGAARGRTAEPPRTRRVATDAERPRGPIVEMVINLDARRIALMVPDGPPYRGDVVTDLNAGVYSLAVDRPRELWVFKAGQVKSGLRFEVWLDGHMPFALEYADTVLLQVTRGIGYPGQPSFASLLDTLAELIHDETAEQHLDAIALLCQLNEVDLYDIVDELWQTKPNVVNTLLLRMDKAFKGSDIDGLANLVRALESFARPAKEVYVDAFDSWVVHPDSFKPDEDRAQAQLSTLQILVRFELFPARSLIIYLDDIREQSDPTSRLPRYGPGSLTYPDVLSKATTPRLYEAKLAARKQIEAGNAEFIVEAFKGVSQVLLSVYQSAHSISKLATARSARPKMPRDERGPGVWRGTFEGGSNMSEAAERYELTSCGTPRAMGYYVENVQFEGFKNGNLLDAKFWQANGRIGGALVKGRIWAGWKVINQAERQLHVAKAKGVGVEWRVADPKVADVIRDMFRVHGFPIKVTYIPAVP